MSIASNTRRPHVGGSARIARDAEDTAEARFRRAHALAVAGRLDEFAAVAARLPDHNRIEPPASPARRRAPAVAGPCAAAARVMARDAASEAIAETASLFPNMRRLDGDR